MYKVIIVEDEDPIRRGLECAIPWTELDCTVVGSGRNGQEGMRAIEELEPDIVIVDINMPIIDGVEMMKILDAVYESAATGHEVILK